MFPISLSIEILAAPYYFFRNIVHNSKLYDLADPGLMRHSKPGCIPVEEACNQANFPGGAARCGEHGRCVGSLRQPTCECNPGWTGQDCSHETMPTTFDPQVNQSFVRNYNVYESIQFLLSTAREVKYQMELACNHCF